MWGYVGRALAIGVPTLLALTAVKTKTSGPSHDPDKPRARDGAPRPSGDRDLQDARYACESLVPASCDGTDVADWIWTYHQKAIVPMDNIAQQLYQAAPDNEAAYALVMKSQAIQDDFNARFPGWSPNAKTWQVPEGQEIVVIQEINSNIDASVALRKEMVKAYGEVNPGAVPQGVLPTDLGGLEDDSKVGTYVGAGAIVGLGLALAFVVANNKKKKSPYPTR